jgi:hypothetical protein
VEQRPQPSPTLITAMERNVPIGSNLDRAPSGMIAFGTPKKNTVMPPLMTAFTIPEHFVLRRCAKLVTKDDVFDGEGNLLKDLPKGIVKTSNAKLAPKI